LEFQSGAQATVDCFFCIPDAASRSRLEIYGSTGAVLAEGTIGQSSSGKVEALLGMGTKGYDANQSKDVTRKFERMAFPKINPYTAQCSYFADCVLHHRPPAINGIGNSLRMMTLIEKAYVSAKTGRTYRLPTATATT
jgi:predicted dehydrogenase